MIHHRDIIGLSVNPLCLCYEKFKVQGSKFKVRSAPLFMLLERATGSCATVVNFKGCLK
jgi:hypothetical protein